jgi:hypothetical protein
MSTWFFPPNQAKHHVKKTFMKRIKLEDTNAKLNVLATQFTQIVRANGFEQSKVQNSPNFFAPPHHPF